jgi:hypothetical protein
MPTMVPITEANLEQATYNLFAIWLARYFDGGSHAIGSNAPVLFTKAVFGFAQSLLPQPQNPQAAVPVTATVVSGITMVFATCPGKTSRRWENVDDVRQHMYYTPVRWNFWVRCSTADDAGRAACLQTAGLLKSILANAKETRVLAANGVHRIRPSMPEVIADNTYILRLVNCEANLRYAVLSQPTD